MRRLAVVTLAAATAVATSALVTACKAKMQDTSEVVADDAARVLIGMDHPYKARTFSKEQVDELNANFAKRRTLGWEIANQVFTPIELTEANTLPLWQTFFTSDEVEKLFTALYIAIPKDRRVVANSTGEARLVPKATVDCVVQRHVDADRLKSRYGRTLYKRLIVDRIAQLKTRDARSLNGVAKGMTLFNLSHVKHMLANYEKMIRCGDDESCYIEGFPKDAVAVKAIWARDDDELELFDTSATGVKAALTGKKVWLPSCPEGGTCKIPASQPAADKMFSVTVRNPDGTDNTFRLTGLHVTTKETSEWTWTTLWWSRDPGTDYGADRPDWFGVYKGKRQAVLQNYKMCITTGFDEGDKRLLAKIPGFRKDETAHAAKTLEAATLAGYAYGDSGWSGSDTAPDSVHSWCSNPYIEKDEGMGDTNCISCHQHAGPGGDMGFERGQERKVFPADYQWSYDFYMDMIGKSNDNFRSKFTEQAKRLQTVDHEACVPPDTPRE